jgi:hypothetical protein
MTIHIKLGVKGGPTSGNFGHAGRPGKLGGSVVKSSSALGLPDERGNLQEARYNIKSNGTTPETFEFFEPPYQQIHKTNELALGCNFQAAQADATRAAYKERIVSELAAETGLPYDDVNRFIRQWASSSNDTTYKSLSIQEAISKEFGVPLSAWQTENIRNLKHAEQIKPIYQRQLQKIDDQMSAKTDKYYDLLKQKTDAEKAHDHVSVARLTAEADRVRTEREKIGDGRDAVWRKLENIKTILNDPPKFNSRAHIFQNRPNPEGDARKLVRAMYNKQQADFQTKGIKYLTVYRGTRDIPKAQRAKLKVGDAVSISTNTAESWSVYYATALGFSSNHNGMTIATKVPVSRVLTSANTGLGCLSEFEFVLLGQRFSNTDRATLVQVGKGD